MDLQSSPIAASPFGPTVAGMDDSTRMAYYNLYHQVFGDFGNPGYMPNEAQPGSSNAPNNIHLDSGAGSLSGPQLGSTSAILQMLMHMLSQTTSNTANKNTATPQSSPAPNPQPHMAGSEYGVPAWLSGGLNFDSMRNAGGNNKPNYTTPKPADKKSGGGGFDIGSMFGGI